VWLSVWREVQLISYNPIHSLHLSVFPVLLPRIFYPFLIYTQFTWYSFQTVWSHYILSFLYHLLCYLKNFILKLRTIQITCTFHLFLSLCGRNNPLCIVSTLLVLLPHLCQVLSSNFHTLSYFPYYFSNLLIPPHFIMPAWTFDNPRETCAVSIIIFFICCQCLWDQGIFILLPLAFLWLCFCIPHVLSSFSFHTPTLGLNFLRPLFVVWNCMSITNNLYYGTHSSSAITLTLQTFTLSCCCTVI